MRNTHLLRAAMTSLLAIGAVGAAASAFADHHQEQCAGVIKAGKNDCATSTNACHRRKHQTLHIGRAPRSQTDEYPSATRQESLK